MKTFFQTTNKYCLIICGVFVFHTIVLAQPFRKYPYLLFSNSNISMQVNWQLTETSTSTISWGTTLDCNEGSFITNEYNNGAEGHQHQIEITNLLPGTKYFYKVELSDTTFYGSFFTAPNQTATSTSFFVFGDTRSNPNIQNTVTNRMLAEIENDSTSQTFSLVTGDLVANGLFEADWDNQFFNPVYTRNIEFYSKIPLMATRGNHENYPFLNAAFLFNKYFPYSIINNSCSGDDMFYSFDYGPAHFAVVDQYDDEHSDNNPSLSISQKNWLENDLATSTKPWKFILLHEPAWSASSLSKAEHTNNFDAQTTIQPLCEQYGVAAVFGGHNHYYAHAFKNNIHHFTLGGGGAPLYAPSFTSGGVIVYAEETHHFAKTKIKNDSAKIIIIRPDGSVVETISLLKPVINPNNFFAQSSTNTQIDLFWNRNIKDDDILLAYDTIDVFGNPTGEYIPGESISGGGIVLATGKISSYSHCGVLPKIYYYKIWSKDTLGNYSFGISTLFNNIASGLNYKRNTDNEKLIFCNYASNQIEISWSEYLLPTNILFYSVDGKIIFNKKLQGENKIKFDISMLKSGIYIIKLISKEETIFKKVTLN